MPDIGDTRLGPILFTANPADSDTDVSVDLSELTFLFRIEEYIDPGGGADWFSGAFVEITGTDSRVLTESPNIDQGSLTFVRSDAPFVYRGTITVPINSTLAGSTEYTWQINLNVTHGTLTFGSVTRNYDTVQVSFTTEASAPLKPTTPSPADSATGVSLLPELSWVDGGGADTYDVYFGTPGDLVQIATGQAGLSIAVLSVLEYNTVYNWRVDAINAQGTTTGDVWSFTTLVFTPPAVSEDGSGNPTGVNNMVTLKRLVVASNNKIFYET